MINQKSLALVLFLFGVFVNAQNQSQIVNDYLENNIRTYNLSLEDVSDLQIDSQHFSESTNVEHVYMQQRFEGKAIYNAISSFALKDAEVVYASLNFENDLENRIQTKNYSISAIEALQNLTSELNLIDLQQPNILEEINSNEFLISESNIASEPIKAELVFQQTENDQLRLAWDMSIRLKDGSHWWSVRVDANNGEILDRNDRVVSCEFEGTEFTQSHNHNPISSSFESQNKNLQQSSNTAQYNVYPMPVESPNHGVRNLEIDPADLNFSPFGWHDTDGVTGAEHTTTRGNNVWAFEDRAGINQVGYSPEGGANLNFDFPIDFNRPAALNEDAAITNLFYWNNLMHDVWANYGFDEASGNFQEMNYSGNGLGEDFVFAQAQDGGGVNNANFATGQDGSNPSMQMYLWTPPGGPNPNLNIASPSSLAGGYFGVEATFGPVLSNASISAELILIEDQNLGGNTDLLDACDNLINTANINGKIAVIRRGDCTFVSKIEKVQNEGALAVIMVNNNAFEEAFAMGGDGANINIPSVMVDNDFGEDLILALNSGEIINADLANNGPYFIDGDFDNGIIAHEYGHGISTRLTGGRFDANCLFNEEQMGEGWSDWLGLMMTIQPGDVATQGRGYGTFAVSQSVTGSGIRPFRYSTDFAVNNATYGLTNNGNLSMPHGIGFVWATMLWDLNWALIDEYGYDPDLYNGNGGNNIAMQLVIDGMKLQSCAPGFVDGRDAILQADQLANNGDNQCLIWDVFANRGLGWNADQGDSTNRFDQVENFDMPPNDVLVCNLSSSNFETEKFEIYPNPANNYFEIQFGNTNLKDTSVEIYDMNGRLVSTKNADQNQQVNVSTLSNGVYVVKIEANDKLFTKKLIIK
ncbi:T9SS-dependent M36 family metallopeptidase [Psychroflexus aestuariivivens]|uniref:T9SS-dependent M36 family metallopeptidase n=1 Tax=Psychroflexus aestuariivivens TaxID=1795040 RepID=UPI000FD72310|nr:T9SS-dependent M36 family metallopeptidase [Psychroflexus aestuariivivens]